MDYIYSFAHTVCYVGGVLVGLAARETKQLAVPCLVCLAVYISH